MPMNPEKQGKYFREVWYEKNRDEINEKRRERYRTDKKYRDEQKERSRENQRLVPRKTVRRKKTRLNPVKIEVTVKGKKLAVDAFHIGDVARALGRTRATIVLWEKKGVIPEALHTSPSSGWRLYTADQVAMLRETFFECGADEPGAAANPERAVNLERFAKLVRERWKKMPNGVGDWRRSAA